jgi:hypothetical protein
MGRRVREGSGREVGFAGKMLTRKAAGSLENL